MIKLKNFLNKTSLLLLSSLMLVTIFSCDDDNSSDGFIQLGIIEKSDLLSSLPNATKKIEFEISSADLDFEVEVLNGSNIVSALYDDDGILQGWSRLVNTGVGCHDNKCAAIKFIIVYDADLEYTTVFHPSDTTIAEFYKGLADNIEDSEIFTSDDWNTLHSLMSDPPTTLLEVEDRFDMVDAETGATYELYQDVVVAQAAYTTYTVLEYLIHTRELIQSEFISGE